jgi:hypothetical protein
MIFETLQEETKARGRRRVEVINLGLEPWEAIELGLAAEPIEKRSRNTAVAQYVRDKRPGGDWTDWLQKNRVELNAMTTPQLIEWLDRKVEEHEGDKLIPPGEIISNEMTETVTGAIRDRIIDQVLREAKIDERVTTAFAQLRLPDDETLVRAAGRWVGLHRDRSWRDYVAEMARGVLT